MCRACPSALIPGYFESCADSAVRETEQNAESEVYPGLKCQPVKACFKTEKHLTFSPSAASKIRVLK